MDFLFLYYISLRKKIIISLMCFSDIIERKRNGQYKVDIMCQKYGT